MRVRLKVDGIALRLDVSIHAPVRVRLLDGWEKVAIPEFQFTHP